MLLWALLLGVAVADVEGNGRLCGGRGFRAPMRGFCAGLLRLLLGCVFFSLLSCREALSLRRGAHGDFALGSIYVPPAPPEEKGAATVVGCFPRVVLSPGNATYYCEVRGAALLRGLSLYASYYTPEGRLCGGWPASLGAATNCVSFVPATAAPSGTMTLVITKHSASGAAHFLPVTTNASVHFLPSEATHARFTAPLPYYGLHFAWTTNMPREDAVGGALLVRAGVDCPSTARKCSAGLGCHNVTDSHRLPLPGIYSLCVTADGWRGHYLPWGQSLLEVKALVTVPLYLVSGARTSIKAYDAALGSPFSRAHRVFLTPCLGVPCEKSDTVSVESVVHVDTCRRAPLSHRVYYSEDRPLYLHPWNYAVCVELSPCTGAASCGVTPSALPVTALVNAFVLAVVDVLGDTLVLGLTGGDLGRRSLPYYVCFLPTTASCDSELRAAHACVRGATPNAPFLHINRSRAQLPDAVTLCLVAANTTFWGRRYVWVQKLASVTLRDAASVSDGRRVPKALIVAIVIGVVTATLLAVDVLVRCHLRRRRARRVASGVEVAGEPAVREPDAVGPRLNPLVGAGQKEVDLAATHARRGTEGADLGVPFTPVSALPAAEDGRRRPPPGGRRRLEEDASATVNPHRGASPETVKPPAPPLASREESTNLHYAQRDTSVFEAADTGACVAANGALTAANNPSQVSGAAALYAGLRPRGGEVGPAGRRAPSAAVEERGAPQHAAVADSATNAGHALFARDEPAPPSPPPVTAARVTLKTQEPSDELPAPQGSGAATREGESKVLHAANFAAAVVDTARFDAQHSGCRALLPAIGQDKPPPREGAHSMGKSERQAQAGREVSGSNATAASCAVSVGSMRDLTRGSRGEKDVGSLTKQAVGATSTNEPGVNTSCASTSVVAAAPVLGAGMSTTTSSTATVSRSMSEELPCALCLDRIGQPPGMTSCGCRERSPTAELATSLGESECETVGTLSSSS
ncbi:uncharacterized protein Tco025E_04217 [Trypanosoma conorhini]|uniref:Membrane-associated protein n=1 Tax=Trypanosoma conorhini TaxID=83891 RepID=A0A3R7NJL0_9TRYP|nr:uncharacterized protein Tco025E_04217 [Trypanosoma conorhini]RNF19353.1 hypothetical protein Tco025E_04217 [Trypanosoma conorhini]